MKKIDANVCFGFWPKRKIDASPAVLIRRMDKGVIDKALVSSLHGIYNDFKEANDETIGLCQETGGRFIPVATINPQTHFGVLGEVDRIVEMGFRIVRFWPMQQEWHVGQRHFNKLIKKISQTDLTIMLPSTESISAIGDIAETINNNVILETVRAIPKLAEIIAVAQDCNNLFIETHLICSPDFVEVLSNELGADRVVFGSGMPFFPASSSAMPIENSDISEQEKESIFSGNIRRILKI